MRHDDDLETRRSDRGHQRAHVVVEADRFGRLPGRLVERAACAHAIVGGVDDQQGGAVCGVGGRGHGWSPHWRWAVTSLDRGRAAGTPSRKPCRCGNPPVSETRPSRRWTSRRACEPAVRSCLQWVHYGRCSRAIHSRIEGGQWRSAVPAFSHLPRKRTASTSTSVTSSRSNTVLGPLLSMCACKASRCAACREPISRSVVWCSSACRAILHVIVSLSCHLRCRQLVTIRVK